VTSDDTNKPKVRTLLELPFPDSAAPPELSVAIVSLVELCQLGMPDPSAVREAIKSAAFGEAPEELAVELGGFLALDNKVFSFPVRNLRHQLYGRERNEVPVRLLVTEGESAEGPVIFVSTLFNGAIEADLVKAAAHVTDKQPLTGATATNSNGAQLRRVFWDVEGAAGVRGLMISGPDNVEDVMIMRAITAFNLVRRN
jgi:hypothetical protein